MAFAGAQPEQDLESAVFQISLQGNEGARTTFFDLTKKAVDLGLMEEELAGTIRFRVGPVSVNVGGDMEGVEPSLPVFDAAERMGEVAATRADGFDLRSGQDHPSLHGFQNGVEMPCPAVVDFNGFQGAFFRRPSRRLRGFLGAGLAGRLGRGLRGGSADDFVTQFPVSDLM